MYPPLHRSHGFPVPIEVSEYLVFCASRAGLTLLDLFFRQPFGVSGFCCLSP
ncbi:hypothetical protein SynMITS9220_01699 [Synechococcus sp. MIT S9220]|nr:hypothetical protein SynMITS9220_01699 [Synechococcus sp. MIT S9220]